MNIKQQHKTCIYQGESYEIAECNSEGARLTKDGITKHECVPLSELSDPSASLDQDEIGKLKTQVAVLKQQEVWTPPAKGLDDLTEDEVSAVANGANFHDLFHYSNQIGERVKNFKAYFTKYSPIIAAMLVRFPRAGSKTKIEVAPNVWMGRAEYVKSYYGVSLRWLQRLIKGDAEPKPNEEEVDAAESAQREEREHDTEQPAEATTEEEPESEATGGAAPGPEDEARHAKAKNLAFQFISCTALKDPKEFAAELERVNNALAQFAGVAGRFTVTHEDLKKPAQFASAQAVGTSKAS